MKEKQRRDRRTNKAIEKDIMEATKRLVEEKGFPNLTLTGIVQEAGVEPNVFYNRYDDLYSLLEKFIQEYDYFFSDVINLFDNVSHENYNQYIEERLTTLVKSFSENKYMQKLLIWELCENNDITQKSAEMREQHTAHAVQILDDYFVEKGYDTDFRVLISLIIGGVFYLILHRERSTFCGIDFNTRRGEKLLIDTISNVLSLIYADHVPNKQVIEIAKKMKANGIDAQTISKYTDLTISDIEQL